MWKGNYEYLGLPGAAYKIRILKARKDHGAISEHYEDLYRLVNNMFGGTMEPIGDAAGVVRGLVAGMCAGPKPRWDEVFMPSELALIPEDRAQAVGVVAVGVALDLLVAADFAFNAPRVADLLGMLDDRKVSEVLEEMSKKARPLPSPKTCELIRNIVANCVGEALPLKRFLEHYYGSMLQWYETSMGTGHPVVNLEALRGRSLEEIAAVFEAATKGRH